MVGPLSWSKTRRSCRVHSQASGRKNGPRSLRDLAGLVVLAGLLPLIAAPVWAVDDHLLLCETVVTPTAGEFIEIANPTVSPIALDNYYLSDDEDYALLPGASGAGPAPSIGSFDFIARFPAGASISAGGVIVVAFDAAGFLTTYGSSPDYEIKGTDAAVPDMIATDVGSSAGLTNSGESATLFVWDGSSDLVSDVDMLNIGTPSGANDTGDKTGLAVDGPDGGTDTSTYANDAATIPQQASDPGFGFSTKRATLEGAEATGAGNGITGDDETTELITTTWDSVYTAPDPGTCSVLSPVARVVINEFVAKGTEWVELYNAGTAAQDLTGWTLTDGSGTTDTLSGSLAAGAYLVVNNTFSLSNTGDSILLSDVTESVVDQVAYGTVGGAPLPQTGHSAARPTDGADTNDDARDWNLDTSPTQGTANDPPGVSLGSSILFNEFDNYPASGGDKVELFNPTGSPVDITGWALSDGDSLQTLGSLSVPASGWLSLEEGVDFNTDFSSSDVGYLYDASGVRVDQLGWSGEFEDDCLARVPDGVGPNTGFEWTSSGGGTSLLDQACTLGRTNTPAEPLTPVINEFVANHTGTDTHEFIEIFGDPSTDYSDLSVLVVDGDTGETGALKEFFSVGTTDAAGFWTTGFLNSVLENGTQTLLLVEGFGVRGIGDLDLDVDDDGTFDIEPWSRILDDVAADDGGAGDLNYSTTILDTSFSGGSFAPGGASRIPNGMDTDAAADWTKNDFDGLGLPGFTGTPDLGEAVNTPGLENALVEAPPPTTPVLINETDADTPGSDAEEFVELYDGGIGNTALDGLVVVLYNGSGDASYNALDLDGFSTDGSGYFIIGNAAVAGVDLVIAGNGLQNGADAVALFFGDAADFPNGTGVVTEGLVDAIVYDTDDSDDAGLLALLNAGQPQVNERGGGDGTGHSNQRCANGSGGGRNTFTYLQASPTPDGPNDCPPVFINETDADTPGSDSAEFIELYNGGIGTTSLDGLVVVLYNGNGDVSYNAFDLDGFSTNAGGYFVIGNAGVSNVGLVIPGNGLQNGADAVAIYEGDAASFPNGTAVTTANLIDAIVYDTADSDDAGLLPLLEAGQPQVDEAGGGNKDLHSNQRCPNGFGGLRVTEFYAQAVPTPGVMNDCAPLEIFEVQGSGAASPFEGSLISMEDNVVTALRANGFFMQTPTARDDADPLTSNGIFVFTDGGTEVGIAVGDLVNVTGVVVEFFGFTEIGDAPGVVVTGTGALPPYVDLDATTPDPGPFGVPDLERLEGMLVRLVNGLATGPTDRFGDTAVVAQSGRSYREVGIEFPGLPTLPVWDGNQEIFEIDPDGLGLPDADMHATTVIPLAEGPLGFSFGDYQILPSTLTLGTEADVVVPVRPRESGEFTVGSLNMFRLFAPDPVRPEGAPELPEVSPEEYEIRLGKFADYILNVLDAPDILAVQEVESLSVLQDLADEILGPEVVGPSYTAYLIEGNDVGGIDVGFLVKDSIAVDAVTQLGKDELLTFDGSLLHDRPPLLLEGRYMAGSIDFPVHVMVVHNRSLNGIDDPVDGVRVRQKRLEQAQSIATKVQALQVAEASLHLVVLGDFNAFQFTDGYVDAVGQIRGEVVPADNLLSGPDLVDPNLANLVETIDPLERYSFVFGGSAQVLDHALVSEELLGFVSGFQFGRGNADAKDSSFDAEGTPLRSSDHDGFVMYVAAGADLAITKVESADPVTAGHLLTYTVTVTNNGPVAATSVAVTETLPAGVTFVDTSGCSEDPNGVPTCSLGTIEADSFKQFTVTVLVNPDTLGTITNTVSVVSGIGDQNLENNEAMTETTVAGLADLSVAKVGDVDLVTALAPTLVYTVTVSNIGPSTAMGVEVTDTLPAGVTFVSTSGCAEDPNGVPTCGLGSIAPGTSADYTITITAPPLTEGTLVNSVTVSGATSDPVAGNNSATEETQVDTLPPSITLYNSDADTGDGELEFCEETGVDIDRLLVEFSEAMRQSPPEDFSDTVDDPDNYLLVETGPDFNLETFSCEGPVGDDVEVALTGVTYDPGTFTATVGLVELLQAGHYRLLVCGGISDLAGNSLNTPEGRGAPGADDNTIFRIEPNNLLENTHFDCDGLPWIIDETVPDVVLYSAEDVNEEIPSGSMEFDNPTTTGQPESYSIGQCVGISESAEHSLGGRARLSLEGDPTESLFVGLHAACEFFDAPACGGSSLGVRLLQLALLDTEGTWIEFETMLPSQSGGVSALCFFGFESVDGESQDGFFDALYLRPLEPMFSDGFESGDFGRWVSSTEESQKAPPEQGSPTNRSNGRGGVK